MAMGGVSAAGALFLSAWFVLNVLLTVHNKILMGSGAGLTPLQLTLFHTLATCLLSLPGAVSGDGLAALRGAARGALPWAAGLLFAANIALGNHVLDTAPPYVVHIFRATTPVFVMALLWVCRLKLPSRRRIALGLVVVVLCALVFLSGEKRSLDAPITWLALVAVLMSVLSNVLSASKSVLTERMLSTKQLTSTQLLVFCAGVSAAFCALAVAFSAAGGASRGIALSDVPGIVLNTLLAAALNYCNFQSMRNGISSVGINIAGNVKAVVMVLLSIPIHHASVPPLTLLLCGAVVSAASLFVLDRPLRELVPCWRPAAPAPPEPTSATAAGAGAGDAAV